MENQTAYSMRLMRKVYLIEIGLSRIFLDKIPFTKKYLYAD
jgi:hypothetical protein